jgi:TIR domain
LSDVWNTRRISTDCPQAKGLVIVYDGRTWIESPAYEALVAIHPQRPVVFVRSRTKRFAPDIERFTPVPLFDTSTFSHCQPGDGVLSGYALVIEALGGAKPAQDTRRRGYAFISYAGPDKQAVCDRLVPALAANDIGFFDYRFTERLDESRLHEEIERRIGRCAVLVVYSTVRWRGSPYTTLELELASKMGKPCIAVLPKVESAPLASAVSACAFEEDSEGDRDALGRAVELATGQKLRGGSN